MAVDERDRHRLRTKLEEVLGPREAATLMASLPQVTWDQVATKDDLRQLEDRLVMRFEAALAVTKAELMTHTLKTVLITNVTSLMAVAALAFGAARLA